MITFNRRDGSLAPQDSVGGSQSCGRPGEMFEHETQENMIEVPVGEGKLEQVCLVELDISLAGSRNSETRLFERGGGNVNGHNVCRRVARGEENGLRACTASAFKNQTPCRVRGVMVEQFA